jgi:hypothetical protein
MAIFNTILINTGKKALPRYILPAILFLAVLVMLYLYNPAVAGFYPPCIFKRLTQLNCPGCGSARACHQLLHGHVYAAMDYNLLVVLFLPLMAWGYIVQLTGRGHALWTRIARALPVLVIICVFWILRNIDMYPFLWLNADK